MKNKLITLDDAAARVTDGYTVMIGGFMGCGNAHHLIVDGSSARHAMLLPLVAGVVALVLAHRSLRARPAR